MFNSEEKDRQAELFSDLSGGSKKPKKAPFKLGKIALSLSYESTLILTIGLIMLLIVCYSLGVERGRHLAQLKTKKLEIVEENQDEERAEESSPKPKKKKVRIKLAAEPKYTIQVATFRKQESVEKEKVRLKNKGYHPFVLSRSGLSEICVGGYQKINEASGDLKELRKIYGDCYVRNR